MRARLRAAQASDRATAGQRGGSCSDQSPAHDSNGAHQLHNNSDESSEPQPARRASADARIRVAQLVLRTSDTSAREPLSSRTLQTGKQTLNPHKPATAMAGVVTVRGHPKTSTPLSD